MFEFRVNEFGIGIEQNASVAMEEDGDFVVAWMGAGSVRVRQFSSDGIASNGEFRISGLTAASAPDVAYHESGEFTVVWSSADPLLSGVFLRRFDNAGAPIGVLSEVVTGKNTALSIATDSDGYSFVVWEGLGDGSAYGVFARRLDSSGSLVGSTFQIRTIAMTRVWILL